MLYYPGILTLYLKFDMEGTSNLLYWYKSEELFVFDRFSSSLFELLDQLGQWSQFFLLD